MPAVLDASALVAMFLNEPGGGIVTEVIESGASVSTVNLAEMTTVLLRHGVEYRHLLAALLRQVSVEPFTEDDALAVAELYPKVSSRGLSMGDRSCIALGQRLGAVVITAERSWAELELGVEVRLIR